MQFFTKKYLTIQHNGAIMEVRRLATTQAPPILAYVKEFVNRQNAQFLEFIFVHFAY